MSDKVTVVCPHCGSTGSYPKSFQTGDGSSGQSCKNCHKSFRIHYHGGQVDEVKKS